MARVSALLVLVATANVTGEKKDPARDTRAVDKVVHAGS
jgi:hypothetical protein